MNVWVCFCMESVYCGAVPPRTLGCQCLMSHSRCCTVQEGGRVVCDLFFFWSRVQMQLLQDAFSIKANVSSLCINHRTLILSFSDLTVHRLLFLCLWSGRALHPHPIISAALVLPDCLVHIKHPVDIFPVKPTAGPPLICFLSGWSWPELSIRTCSH